MTDLHLATPDTAKDRRLRAQTSQAREARALRKHVRKIERVLEAILASPALTKPQRAELVGLLAGTRGGAPAPPQPAVNADVEHRLITQYRVMTRTDKHIVSILFKRLAGRRKGGK